MNYVDYFSVGKQRRNASRVHNHQRYAQREMLYRQDRGARDGKWDRSTRSRDMISNRGGGMGLSTGSTTVSTNSSAGNNSTAAVTGGSITVPIATGSGSITGSTTAIAAMSIGSGSTDSTISGGGNER